MQPVVGLAAPQVGVLKRVVVIDVGEGPIVLLNPRMLESSEEHLHFLVRIASPS